MHFAQLNCDRCGPDEVSTTKRVGRCINAQSSLHPFLEPTRYHVVVLTSSGPLVVIGLAHHYEIRGASFLNAVHVVESDMSKRNLFLIGACFLVGVAFLLLPSFTARITVAVL